MIMIINLKNKTIATTENDADDNTYLILLNMKLTFDHMYDMD